MTMGTNMSDLPDSHDLDELLGAYALDAVSPEEADFEEGKISTVSPIGRGLLGKEEGDEVEIDVPAGKLNYRILKISR